MIGTRFSGWFGRRTPLERLVAAVAREESVERLAGRIAADVALIEALRAVCESLRQGGPDSEIAALCRKYALDGTGFAVRVRSLARILGFGCVPFSPPSSDDPDEEDPYAILGVEPSAGPDQIKQAYRRRLLHWHPDHNADPGAVEMVLRLQRAYQSVISGQAGQPAASRHGQGVASPRHFPPPRSAAKESRLYQFRRLRGAALLGQMCALLCVLVIVAVIVDVRHSDRVISRFSPLASPVLPPPPKVVATESGPVAATAPNSAADGGIGLGRHFAGENTSAEILPPPRKDLPLSPQAPPSPPAPNSAKNASLLTRAVKSPTPFLPSSAPSGKEHKTTIERSIERSQVEAFIARYCRTYSAGDVDGFLGLFADDAVENGVPVSALRSQYTQSLNAAKRIHYTIHIADYTVTGKGSVRITGTYDLRVLFKTNTGAHSQGPIELQLVSRNNELKVKSLDYSFARYNMY